MLDSSLISLWVTCESVKLLTVGSVPRAWQRRTLGINNQGLGILVEAPMGLQKTDIRGGKGWLPCKHALRLCVASLPMPVQPTLCLLLSRPLFADQLIWDLTEPYLWIAVGYHVESKDP